MGSNYNTNSTNYGNENKNKNNKYTINNAEIDEVEWIDNESPNFEISSEISVDSETSVTCKHNCKGKNEFLIK